MKKYFILVIVLASLMVTGLVVYAESDEVALPEWFSEMMEWRRTEIKEAAEAGDLSEAEAAAWLEHLDEMVEFHEEAGFEGGFGGGGCRGGISGESQFGGGCRRGGGFSQGMTFQR